MKPGGASRRLWLRRIGWLIFIWAASIAALAVVAMAVRGLMNLAGMTASS
ncbi:Protein of unknown function [Sphingobium faniae]|nr:Protein of unknown function [Sphingobium faniae]